MTSSRRRGSDYEFHFSLAADSRAAGRVRSEARRLYRFDSAVSESELLVAISEIVQNAVDAHRAAGISQDLDIAYFGSTPQVRVTDHGEGFDSVNIMATTPAPHTPSGRGLRLAYAFVPSLMIESGPNGTVVGIPLAGATWKISGTLDG